MQHISMIGSMIVTGALVCYSIAILTEQAKKILHKRVVVFISLGVALDITATACMILGSSRGFITFHGILGYSSLILMLTDMILLWRLKSTAGMNAVVPERLHIYSRVAYIWWVAAYITGGLMVALR